MLADLAAAAPGPPVPGACVRSPTPEDLDVVVDLYGAAAQARGHANPIRREDLRIRWLMLDNPHDAMLVTHAEREPHVLAYASTAVDLEVGGLEATVHLEGQVHPQATEHGLASWILELAERVGAEALADAAQAPFHDVARADAGPASSDEPLDDAATAPSDAAPIHGTQQAAATALVRIRTALLDGDAEARAWFSRRGFVAVRHLLELRLDLHAPPPAPRWPAGICVRRFVPGVDDEVLWRTHQAAFADVPTHLPISRDDYLADRSPAENPELVLLAEHRPDADDAGRGHPGASDDGAGSADAGSAGTGRAHRALHGVRRPVVDERRGEHADGRGAGQAGTGQASAGDTSPSDGRLCGPGPGDRSPVDADLAGAGCGSEVVGIAVCRAGTEVAAEDGWVRDLGVLPGWRRHGIAMALLRTAFAVFRERGLTGVALEVDDVTLEGAVALYRRAGMRVTRRTDVLERVTRPTLPTRP